MKRDSDFEVDSELDLNTDFIYTKGETKKVKFKEIKKMDLIEIFDDDFQ